VSVRRPDLPKTLKVAALISETPVRFSNVGRAIVIDAAWTEGDGIALDDSQTRGGADDDLHRIALTSGTTGDAKAVGFTQQMMLARVHHYFWVLGGGLSACTRVFVDPGLATAFGYTAVMYVLAHGGMVMFRGSDALETMQAFGLYKIQGAIGTPAAMAEFADYYERAPQFASGFEAIFLGGSLPHAALADRVRANLCTNLSVAYGSSEAGFVCKAPAKVATPIHGAVGFVVPGFDVEAVDGAGQTLSAGEVGRIRIRGRMCVNEYIGDPATSAKSFKDGWFYPGDLGKLTADRMLVLSGREATVLNVGGDKINPERIEHVLTSYPAIAQAGVAGVADKLGVERICAAVVWRSQPDEAGLRAHCQRLLPAEFIPLRFVSVATLARNETGKIDRDHLASTVKDV
jgi:acyl-CoA synthetase (AMP-forming)/AMP-acid ligase II